MAPQVTVILTTHNNPRALEFCLTGFACQDWREFEIIVADDGSREDTREMVRKMRSEFAVSAPWLKLTHVWQPHRGYYGKAAIVNKAIMHARTDYLILADGDVIPRADHVRTHMELRKPNCFLAGGDFRLVDASTKGLTLDDVRSGRAFTKAHLMKLGHPKTKKFFKLTKRGWFTELFDACNVSPARWSGSNASCWRELLIKVNGFDESFRSWGKDDTELGTRLWNAGVRSKHVRHNAIVMHMYHGESKFTAEGKVTNLGLLAETQRTKRTRARIGIDERVDDLRVETQNP